MATRSFIITANPKGDYTGIYCHWDGYPSHNGVLLAEHYTTRSKVRELIRLGSLSSLGVRAKPLNPEAHSYDCKEDGTTVAFRRDRGDIWEVVKPDQRDALVDMVDGSWAEYVYLFWNGMWHYAKTYDVIDGKPMTTITPEVLAEIKGSGA